MAVPIFPNSSFFIAYGDNPVFFEHIRLGSVRHRARIYVCQSLKDFTDALRVIQVPTGLFIDGVGLKDPILANVQQDISKLTGSPVCYVTDNATHALASLPHIHTMVLNQNPSPSDWVAGLDGFMKSLTPNGLEGLMLECAKSIMPRFFPEIGDFSRTPYMLSGADYQLNFSLSAGDFIGQCLVRIKWSDVCAMLPRYNSSTDSEKILDCLKESMNQCLGSVVQGILRIHPELNMRIGLSTGFDLLKIPEIQSIKYFPSVHVSDNKRRVGFSIGYFNILNEPIFDLSGFTPNQTEEEIEFL